MCILCSLQLILAATEQFNKKPKVGVAFLLEQGVLHSPLNPNEVAGFLLDNPGLVKARIGEYVGERKNTDILHAFVRWGGGACTVVNEGAVIVL